MSDYPEAACEVCGEMISQFPPAKSRHMKKHTAKPEATEPTPAPTPEVAAPAPAKAERPMPVTDDVELQKLMLLAKATQERLLNAPNLVVAEQTSDEMMELRKMYCPESLGPNATKHVFFGLTKDMAKLASRGYMPVIDPVKRRPVVWEEHTMSWIPSKIADARVEASQQASRNILQRASSDALKGDGMKNTTGDKISGRGLEIEEFSITNKDVGG